MRIVRFLARAGISSRRKAAELIEKGLIELNGEVVRKPWIEVNPGKDTVRYNGEEVRIPEEWTYIIINKPRNVITSCSDEYGRKTVMDLIEIDIPGLVPAGRLDEDSEGLLLLSNDGKLINRLIHPSFEIEKEYKVVLPRKPDNELKKILKGIKSGGELLKAVDLKFEEDNTIIITLIEGKNREIRRMLGHLGYKAEQLIRTRIGNIELGDLGTGKWRKLSKIEIEELKELCYES